MNTRLEDIVGLNSYKNWVRGKWFIHLYVRTWLVGSGQMRLINIHAHALIRTLLNGIIQAVLERYHSRVQGLILSSVSIGSREYKD